MLFKLGMATGLGEGKPSSNLLHECGWGPPSEMDPQETPHMNTHAEPA